MRKKYKNILIIGSGIAGLLLKKDIEKNVPECKVVGFVDDDRGQVKKVEDYLGTIKDLASINNAYNIDEMIIAIPSATGILIREILLNNIQNRVSTRIVPRSQSIIGHNRVKYSGIEDIGLDDLLGRPFRKKNVLKLIKFYKDKIVLITGGAGSIGSEIVRQLLDLEVKKVVVYDNSEYLIFNLDQSLKENLVKKMRYKLIIGNILNVKKLDFVMKKYNPDIVFHAAAYKHVYLMQENADEAVINNIIGTKNVITAAINNKIKNFTFISTDKVVNPTNIMGATKKISEFFISSQKQGITKFNIVRFGNVINSNGSVLPTFERQINERGYITVTHKEIKRFFMSIREASQLVINSTMRNKHGEIYILDMGELLNIFEVGMCLIRSKNLIPNIDIKIKFIGLKKGEKLIEELFTKKEEKKMIKTNINNVFRLKNHEKCSIDIEKVIEDLKFFSEQQQNKKILKYLKKMFPSLKV